MSILSMVKKWFRKEERSNLENPNVPITGATIENSLANVARSKSGTAVGPGTALTHSPIWSCVDLISGDISRIPWFTYRQRLDGGRLIRERAMDHPTWKLLTLETNVPWELSHMTSESWIQRILGHALLYKGGYTRIHRSADGRPERLEWLHSDRVQVDRFDGALQFRVTNDGMLDEVIGNRHTELVDEWDMFHINGLSLDELGGLCLINFARNSIGRALAAEGFSDDFYNNYNLPTGFFKHPQNMTDPAIQKFMRRMATMNGQGNRHNFGLLEEGMEFNPTGINPHDAMLLDMLKFSVPEASRWFRVPLHKLGDEQARGYNTTEAENKAFLSSTLGTWINRLCKQANVKLFAPEERGEYYTEFDISQYAKGNIVDQANAYRIGIEAGYLVPNEARERENLNPIDGGEEPRPKTSPTPIQQQDNGEKEESGNEGVNRHMAVAVEAFKRLGGRIARAANVASKDPAKFIGFVNELEVHHRETLVEQLTPSCQLAGSQPLKAAQRLIDESRDILLTACECQADELEASVALASKRLTNGLATSLAWELFDEKRNPELSNNG